MGDGMVMGLICMLMLMHAGASCVCFAVACSEGADADSAQDKTDLAQIPSEDWTLPAMGRGRGGSSMDRPCG